MRRFAVLALAFVLMSLAPFAAQAADDPDLIFRKSTVFHWVSPNDKLATYAIDDPAVDGVACHFTVPEKGGFKGWIGVAEEVSDISLPAGKSARSPLRPNSSRATMCFAAAAPCCSRRCRSCAAAM